MTVSLREVAEHAGVSTGTVSNVLNRPDTVNADMVRRVGESISALGYVRNDAARQLRAGRSAVIGLVVFDFANPFFTDLARRVEKAAARHGLSLLLADSDDDPDREGAYLDLFERQRVAGVLVTPTRGVERIEQLAGRGTPTVLLDPGGPGLRVSSVGFDAERGGEIAAEHLVGIGRRRIAFVGGPLSLRQIVARLEGAQRMLPPDASLEILTTTGQNLLEGRRAGELLLARPPDRRPDAVFAANDLVAMGVLQALVGGGVRVPDDVAIVGFDDIDFAASAIVPLSSVRQATQAMADASVELLTAAAADPDRPPEHRTFHPELIIRESTLGPAR